MIDAIIRKPVVAAAKAFLAKLQPAVNIHVPNDAPLPSISAIKRYAVIAAKINVLEPAIEALSNEDLKAKTAEFKERIRQATAREVSDVDRLRGEYRAASTIDDRQRLKDELKAAEKILHTAKQNALNDLLPEA